MGHDRILGLRACRLRSHMVAKVKPTKSILDPSFSYTSAGQTDIRKTFARERKRLKEEQEKARQNVTDIKRKA